MCGTGFHKTVVNTFYNGFNRNVQLSLIYCAPLKQILILFSKERQDRRLLRHSGETQYPPTRTIKSHAQKPLE